MLNNNAAVQLLNNKLLCGRSVSQGWSGRGRILV